METFGAERWSDGRQLLGKANRIGNFVTIELPAPDSASRTLVLYATQAPDYGILRFTVNGERVAKTFDGYAESVQPAAAFVVGEFKPQDGRFVLRAEVVGANPAAKGAKYYFGLDCLSFQKP